MRLLLTVTMLLMLFCMGIGIQAQTDTFTCPVLVENALTAIDDLCSDTSRNQACYGSQLLSVTPYSEVDDFQFEAPGDIVGVANLQSLQSSAMNLSEGAWGV